MATLLNTLLAALFPALLAPEHEMPVATEMEPTIKVSVVSQEETGSNDYRVYLYPQSETSCHS